MLLVGRVYGLHQVFHSARYIDEIALYPQDAAVKTIAVHGGRFNGFRRGVFSYQAGIRYGQHGYKGALVIKAPGSVEAGYITADGGGGRTGRYGIGQYGQVLGTAGYRLQHRLQYQGGKG
ncbi:hypothetical protein GCM10011418_33720 [Sphingobacterium alkalisoli]|nr:hypothetical protein GCM10011418_33720 [Sphingobacterium alkalisoli]